MKLYYKFMDINSNTIVNYLEIFKIFYKLYKLIFIKIKYRYIIILD